MLKRKINLIIFIISLFYVSFTVDVFAADLGITSSSGYSQYACECGVSSCRYCSNNSTTTKISFGTTADNPGYLWFGGAYLFYGSSNFLSTNSYSITYKTSFVGMSDDSVEEVKNDLNDWKYVINGYVNSTVGYSDSYINDFKCSTKFDTTTTNTFITTCNVNLNTNVSRLQVKVNYWDNATEDGNYHVFYYSPQVKSTFVSITYSEGVGAQIDNQTIVIQQQTDKLNDSIKELLDVFRTGNDDTLNADADSSFTGNSDKFDNFNETETGLKNSVDVDISSLVFDSHTYESSFGFVWDNVTNFINSNIKVFRMVIAVLTLSFVGLVIGRL